MEQLWNTLLKLKERVSEHPESLEFCCFNPLDGNSILIDVYPAEVLLGHFVFVGLNHHPPTSQLGASFRMTSLSKLDCNTNQILSENEIHFLKVYLPYCFLSPRANLERRAIAVAHFAQTLDGKIATQTGDSRWIGNEENLVHAHRMRALCDGIMVGKKTLENDFPRLTVRKVEGGNPRRVVLGSPQSNYDCLFDSSPDPVIVIGKEASQQNGKIIYHHLESENGHIVSQRILECLYQQGIKTVYIEGGAITTSNFLRDKTLDVIQLHISPFLFGSGKTGIVLPNIQNVKEGVAFQTFCFHTIGDTVMFVGEPIKK